MTTTLDDLFMSLTYEDVKDLIRKTVYHYWKQIGGEYDELLGEALLEFTRAYREFASDKSQFKTWLINRIRWRMIDLIREVSTKSRYLKRQSMPDNVSCSLKTFSLFEFMDSLSHDSRYVVSLVFDSPLDIYIAIKEKGEPNAINVRHTVKEFLHDLGWSGLRIKRAFSEIREALQ